MRHQELVIMEFDTLIAIKRYLTLTMQDNIIISCSIVPEQGKLAIVVITEPKYLSVSDLPHSEIES